MPRKPAPRPKRAYKKRTTKMVTPRLKSFVNQAIDRRLESKHISVFDLNKPILTVALGTPTNIKLLPEPSQGDGDSDRIGNKITVKKLIVTGFVNMLPYDSFSNPTSPAPLLIKIWIVTSKIVNTNTFSNTPASSSYFFVNNSSTGFQATIRDQLLAVNTDMFTVHKTKTFKIGIGSNSAFTASANPGAAFDNSPMSQRFTIDCSKYVSQLKFDEGQSWATNRNLFMVITASRADGTVTSATLAPCEYHYKVDTYYKDG